MFVDLIFWKSNILKSFEKAGAGKPDDLSDKILKILDMRSISIKKYLKWKFGMGSLNL